MKLTKRELTKIIKEELRFFLLEKKDKKVSCPSQPGNPFHSKSTGRFVDPDKEAGSWSHRYAPSGAKCRGQSSRNSANRKQSYTKVPCGRKSKYKCHKGTPKWKRDDELVDEALFAPEGTAEREEQIFPGSKALRSLAVGILQEIEPVFDEFEQLQSDDDEELLEQARQRCFSPDELRKYRARVVAGIWKGISTYQKAEAGEL